MICRSRRLSCNEFETVRVDTIGAIKVSLYGTIFYLIARLSSPRPNLPLHIELRLKAGVIAKERGEREQLPVTLEPYRDVVLGGVAVHRDTIRLLGVTHVVDADVVMSAPKERNLIEALACAEHVARGGLSLTLRHHPVLDANPFAGMLIRPARDVPRGIHARRTRL